MNRAARAYVCVCVLKVGMCVCGWMGGFDLCVCLGGIKGGRKVRVKSPRILLPQSMGRQDGSC